MSSKSTEKTPRKRSTSLSESRRRKHGHRRKPEIPPLLLGAKSPRSGRRIQAKTHRSPRSPRGLSPRKLSPRKLSPTKLSPRLSPRTLSPRTLSHNRRMSPRSPVDAAAIVRYVVATHAFVGTAAAQLSLDVGDVIAVTDTKEESFGWLEGVCGAFQGWFPANRVRDVEEQAQLCALYDLDPTREGHLTLRSGDRLALRKAFGAWYEAERLDDGSVGLVPANHVRVLVDATATPRAAQDDSSEERTLAESMVIDELILPRLELTATRGRRLPIRDSCVEVKVGSFSRKTPIVRDNTAPDWLCQFFVDCSDKDLLTTNVEVRVGDGGLVIPLHYFADLGERHAWFPLQKHGGVGEIRVRLLYEGVGGVLQLDVSEARGLLADIPSVYAICAVGDEYRMQTAMAENVDSCAMWSEKQRIPNVDADQDALVTIRCDKFAIGTCVFPVSCLTPGTSVDAWFPLCTKDINTPYGDIWLDVKFQSKPDLPH